MAFLKKYEINTTQIVNTLRRRLRNPKIHLELLYNIIVILEKCKNT